MSYGRLGPWGLPGGTKPGFHALQKPPSRIDSGIGHMTCFAPWNKGILVNLKFENCLHAVLDLMECSLLETVHHVIEMLAWSGTVAHAYSPSTLGG